MIEPLCFPVADTEKQKKVPDWTLQNLRAHDAPTVAFFLNKYPSSSTGVVFKVSGSVGIAGSLHVSKSTQLGSNFLSVSLLLV